MILHSIKMDIQHLDSNLTQLNTLKWKWHMIDFTGCYFALFWGCALHHLWHPPKHQHLLPVKLLVLPVPPRVRSLLCSLLALVELNYPISFASSPKYSSFQSIEWLRQCRRPRVRNRRQTLVLQAVKQLSNVRWNQTRGFFSPKSRMTTYHRKSSM